MAAEHDSGSKQKDQAEGAAMERITRAVERVHQERRGGEASEIHSEAGAIPGKDSKLRRIKVPQEVLQENRVLSGKGDDEFSQAYKVLRTRIWQQMRVNGWQTLAITSANPVRVRH